MILMIWGRFSDKYINKNIRNYNNLRNYPRLNSHDYLMQKIYEYLKQNL